MKKTEMLKKNYEFSRVFSKGKYYSGKLIQVFIIKNNTAKNKLGIAVSKKAGNSVFRNKIKRLIRENYRLMEEKINNGNDIILMWKKNNKKEDISYKKIEKDLYNIFSKAHLLEEK